MAIRRRARGGGREVEFFAGLSQSRSLVLYLAAGLAIACYMVAVRYGTSFLVALVANLGLLAIYLAVVNLVTRGAAPRPLPVNRPGLELALLLAYTAFLCLRATEQVPWLDLSGQIPAYRQIDGLLVGAVQAALRPLWPGGALPAAVFQATGNLFWLLLVPLAIFLALGYRPVTLGLAPSRWWVALPLMAIGALPSLAEGDLWQAGHPVELASDFVGTLLATGLAEEVFFRGLLLSRLEAWTGRGLDALALGALVYGLAQAPAYLAVDGLDFTLVTARVVTTSFAPTALAWGYVYLRTRSVAPAALWHASPWPIFPFG